MLGQDLVLAARARGIEAVGVDREELDITNEQMIASVFENEAPDAVFNAASYNLVDKIEDQTVFPLAYAINAEGPGLLARACAERNIPFVHFSTDYVFSGEKREGYSEDDESHPISRYGETKRAGEIAVKEACGRWYVCRTSRLFGRPGSSSEAKISFPALMLKLAKEKPILDIIDEEYGCPTYTPHLAASALDLLTNGSEAGFYHMVNSGEPVTWYKFAEEIFKVANVTTPRRPVSSDVFSARPAKRPRYSALLNTKCVALPSRHEALLEFLSS